MLTFLKRISFIFVCSGLLVSCRSGDECRFGDPQCIPWAALLYTRVTYPDKLFAINDAGTPQIFSYQINRFSGQLTLLRQTSFSGCATISSGMTVDASAKYLYAACATGAGPLAQFSIDSDGGLTRLSPDLTSGFAGPLGGMCADPKGRAVYAVGGGNVHAFLIGSDGRLTLAGVVATGGGTPQQCALDSQGRYLYSPNSATNDMGNLRVLSSGGLQLIGSPVTGANGSAQFVVVSGDSSFVYNTSLSTNVLRGFSINQSTGAPVSIATSFPTGTAPNYVETDPGQRYIFATNNTTANLSAFSLDPSTGLLSALPGSPLSIGTGPQAVRMEPSGQFVYVALTTSIVGLRFTSGAFSNGTSITTTGTVTNIVVTGKSVF